MSKSLWLMLVVLTILCGPVLAAAPKQLGVFRDWQAWQGKDGGETICYISSRPTKQAGKYAKRGDPFLLVTHRPAESSANVVQVIAGYTYQSGSSVSLSIDGKKFELFTDRDSAWAADAATDRQIVAAMQAGTSMTIIGTSSRGTKTTDTYSLRGVTAAHRAINAACGVGG